MEQKKIDRINELAKKSKTVGLSDEEKAEQTALRNEYRKSVIGNLTAQLYVKCIHIYPIYISYICEYLTNIILSIDFLSIL